MAEYQPGVCNIGKAEQKKRYGLGAGATAATLLLTGLVLFKMLPATATILVFFTAVAAFEGLLQGYLNFCAGFASKGIYDVSEDGEQKEEVTDETARKQDKVRALQIHAYSMTGGLVTAAVVFLAANVI